MIQFLSFWILAGLFEYPFFALFLGRSPFFFDAHPFYSFGLHGVSVFILFFSIPKGKGWFHPERVLPKAFLLLQGVFPLFGWLVAPLLYFLKPPSWNPAEEEESRFIPPELRIFSQGFRSKQTRILEELDFMPLADILAGEKMELKRGAIDRLAELKTPESIGMLLTCRSDPSPDVRFFATSALTRIKKGFDEELEAAKREMQKKNYDVRARLLLAKIYLQYARSQLLDFATAHTYEKEALYHLEYCVEEGKANADVYEMLLSIYQSHEDWENMLKIIDQFEQSKTGNAEEIGRLKVDLYFKTGRFDAMTQELSAMKQKGIHDPQWQALTNFLGVY